MSSSTKKLLLDLFVLFQLLSGIILSLSLLTFSIDDFQWRESTNTSVTNSIGLVGAWISSLLYSFLGLT
ncbi:DNA translocase FtsK 4TM domain-containing protein, partial [SAR86 cluster bacterium]|nr:DNA translocase FtsK 4TM domain-containing protein [SAR86 cluster bacterium]